MIYAFTIGAAHLRLEVRVLAESLMAALPDARFLWAVSGPFDGMLLEGFDAAEIAPLDALCISRFKPQSLVSAADRDPALATPDVALSLLNRPGCEGVLVLAPQMVLFSSPTAIGSASVQADVVLMPASIRPELASDLPTDELRSLRDGVFSTSMMAIMPTPNAERFLHWWSDRSHAIVPPQGERHRLRPWLNLAPAMFHGVRILRSPGYGVGRENLAERHFEGSLTDGLRVNGMPLVSFNFEGLDEGLLEAAIPKERDDHPVIESLVRWYRERQVAGAGEVTLGGVPARGNS